MAHGEPPAARPAVIPVYDPAGGGSGRLLAIDLDPSRGDVGHQAAELGQLLERLGGRYVADVATSTGGRHILVPFAAAMPWLELRDVARAIAARFPTVDPAPMCSPGGQISPPGSRAKRGGWRVLTMPLSEAAAAVDNPGSLRGGRAHTQLVTRSRSLRARHHARRILGRTGPGRQPVIALHWMCQTPWALKPRAGKP